MTTQKDQFGLRIFIALGILFFIVGGLLIFSEIFGNDDSSNTNDICSQIRGTPAWMHDNEIIGYGYNFPESYAKQSFNDIVNDYLIPNKITFVWDAKCVHCQNQIKDFGDSWIDYQNSNLTKQCFIL